MELKNNFNEDFKFPLIYGDSMNEIYRIKRYLKMAEKNEQIRGYINKPISEDSQNSFNSVIEKIKNITVEELEEAEAEIFECECSSELCAEILDIGNSELELEAHRMLLNKAIELGGGLV